MPVFSRIVWVALPTFLITGIIMWFLRAADAGMTPAQFLRTRYTVFLAIKVILAHVIAVTALMLTLPGFSGVKAAMPGLMRFLPLLATAMSPAGARLIKVSPQRGQAEVDWAALRRPFNSLSALVLQTDQTDCDGPGRWARWTSGIPPGPSGRLCTTRSRFRCGRDWSRRFLMIQLRRYLSLPISMRIGKSLLSVVVVSAIPRAA